MRLRFPYRYWLVRRLSSGEHQVRRARFNPADCCYWLVDGPFDSQEDAARALAFWKRQFPKENPVRV